MDYTESIFRKSQEVLRQLDVYKQKYNALKMQNCQIDRFGYSSLKTIFGAKTLRALNCVSVRMKSQKKIATTLFFTPTHGNIYRALVKMIEVCCKEPTSFTKA